MNTLKLQNAEASVQCWRHGRVSRFQTNLSRLSSALPLQSKRENCDYISLQMYCVWMVVSVQWKSIISFFFGIAKWLEPSCQSWFLVQFKWSAANLLMSWWLRPLFILSMEKTKHNSRFSKWCVTEFKNTARFSRSSALIRMVLHEKWHGFAKLAFWPVTKVWLGSRSYLIVQKYALYYWVIIFVLLMCNETKTHIISNVYHFEVRHRYDSNAGCNIGYHITIFIF